MLKDIWNYRDFVLGSVKREFLSKYHNSILGAAWNVFNPLAMIIVYTAIFSGLMRSNMPGLEGRFTYSTYLFSGILTWNLFSEIFSRSLTMFLDNSNLLKKMNFPRITLLLIIVLTALINFTIVFSLFLLFLAATDNLPGYLMLLYVAPILVLQIIFSVSLGMVLGIANVFFRDIEPFAIIFLQFWFWMTPIVYVIGILPLEIAQLMIFNPMATLITRYQNIFVYHTWSGWMGLMPTIVLVTLISVLAAFLFKKYSDDMVDDL